MLKLATSMTFAMFSLVARARLCGERTIMPAAMAIFTRLMAWVQSVNAWILIGGTASFTLFP